MNLKLIPNRKKLLIGMAGSLFFLSNVAHAQIIQSDNFEIQIIPNEEGKQATRWNEPKVGFKWVWDDKGSGANRSVAIYEPIPNTGFFHLGHVAVGQHDVKPVGIALKPKKENLLAKPTKFVWLYDDSETDSNNSVAIYRAECPPGFQALGGMATSTRIEPDLSTTSFRCINKSMLQSAQWPDNPLWDDGGSKGKFDISLWIPEFGARKKSSFIIASNSFVPSGTWTPSERDAYVLNFQFNGLKNPAGELPNGEGEKLQKPNLSGPERPTQKLQSVRHTYEMPFFMITDPRYNGDQMRQWIESPIYTISREMKYEFFNDLNNTDCKVPVSQGLEVSFSSGYESQTTWNNSVGASVGITVEAEPALLGSKVGGASLSVTAEYSHEFGGGDAYSSSEDVSFSEEIPPGVYAAAFIKKSDFKVRRSDGSEVRGGQFGFKHGKGVQFFNWAPADWDKDNPCAEGSDILLIDSTDPNHSKPHDLVRGKKYWSKSKNNYLIFEQNGNLLVYNKSDQPLWQLKNTGTDTSRIDRITVQTDGNFAAYTQDDLYIWSALHDAPPEGTYIYLNSEGSFDVQTPNGDVLWSAGRN